MRPVRCGQASCILPPTPCDVQCVYRKTIGSAKNNVKCCNALDFSMQGVRSHGNFWTVWKLCQGLANLSINEQNKVRLCHSVV